MYNNIKIAMIVARDLEHTIGIDNDLPWRCKADLKHFREMTLGKVCIMGRKTFESLPAPLTKRTVIVVSKEPPTTVVDQIFDLPNHTLATSVEQALALAITLNKDNQQIMICGGSTIYKAFMSFIDDAYVSVINTVAEYAEDQVVSKLEEIPKEVMVHYKFFNLEKTHAG